MTSEERHSIDEQPEETCPLVDKLINNASAVLQNIRFYERYDDIKILHDMMWNVEYHGSDIEGQAEQIRAANVAIRCWGEQWKQRALQLEEEVVSLDDQLNVMQQELEEIRQS
jgi:hypothetical protein